MANKTDYREVAVYRNNLCTVGLVTGFDNDVRSNVQLYKIQCLFALCRFLD